ncbi:MAG: MFS transporter, partial [Deltaproteobacteria bacterium]|nr:MFS transporter [Deltaproteobacteria bacterium]
MTEATVYPRFRWFMLLALVVITTAHSVIMIGPAPLMGVIAKEFGMSLGRATGAFMGLFNLFAALSCVAGGVVCDRFGITKSFFWGLVLLAVPSLALPFLGHTFEAVLVIRILQACGVGPILAAVSPVAALWFPPLERGIVTGLQGSSVALGIAIGFVAGPAAFASTGSWQSAMAWLTVICFVGLAFAIVLFLGPKAPDVSAAARAGAAVPEGNGDFKLACRQPVTWVGVFVVFSLCWVLSAFNDLTPAYLAVEPPVGVGHGPMTAGKLMMLFQVAFIVGSAVTGFVMERVFGGRARPPIGIGFCLFGLFALWSMSRGVSSNLPALAPMLAAAGFFQGWVVPNAFAFIALSYPAHITGKLVGMWMGIGLFGGTAGVVAGSVALHHTGRYDVSILIVGVAAAVGLVLSLFLKPPAVFF